MAAKMILDVWESAGAGVAGVVRQDVVVANGLSFPLRLRDYPVTLSILRKREAGM